MANPTRHVFVDFSNLQYEGKRLTLQREPQGPSAWHCHFGNLMALLGDEHRSGFLVTSEPFRGRASAEAAGFTVVTYPRSHSQKEKCVDTRFAVEAVLHGASSKKSGAAAGAARWIEQFGHLDEPAKAVQLEHLERADYEVYALVTGTSSPVVGSSCTYVLVTGDYDQLPTVEALRAQGHLVVTAFWSHGSPQLREASDVFVSLDGHWDALRYHGT